MLPILLLATGLLSMPVMAFSDPVKHGSTRLDNFLDTSNSRISGADLKSSDTISLLGGDSIIDCPGNAATNSRDAVAAKDALLQVISSEAVELSPGICRHAESGKTYAQICNQSNGKVILDSAAAAAALNLLSSTCSRNSASGTLQTSSKLFYTIFAKTGNEVPTSTKTRMTRTLRKRCTVSSQLPVTGCIQDVCDPKIVLDSSGNCPNVGNQDTDGCSYHCELRAARYFGPAATFDGVKFCPGTNCGLAVGQSYTVEKSVSASLSLEAAGPFEAVAGAGISFSYTTSVTNSLEESYEFGEGKCGQWYKAPVLKNSCGKLSEYEPNFGGEGQSLCLKDAPLSTTRDWCVDIQARVTSTADGEGIPDVRIVPRYANCDDSTFYADDAPEQSDQWKIAYGSGNNQGGKVC